MLLRGCGAGASGVKWRASSGPAYETLLAPPLRFRRLAHRMRQGGRRRLFPRGSERDPDAHPGPDPGRADTDPEEKWRLDVRQEPRQPAGAAAEKIVPRQRAGP